jgi:hypothetical protein
MGLRESRRTVRGRAALSTGAMLLSIVSIAAMAEDTASGIPELLASTHAFIKRTMGNSDPAVPVRLAAHVGPKQLVAAFYRGSRSDRLVALDAAAFTRDPFYVAPSLAALMGAADRQVASGAAEALDTLILNAVSSPAGFSAVVPKQAMQLIEQLRAVALDRRLDVDIRSVAMDGIIALSGIAGWEIEAWALALVNDSETIVRQKALGALTLPLSEKAVAVVAKMVAADNHLGVRGQAAEILCENARQHKVKDPSDDLTTILKSTMQTPGMPVSAIGGILACLTQFDGKNQGTLVDIAVAHPDPAVKALWKAVKSK